MFFRHLAAYFNLKVKLISFLTLTSKDASQWGQKKISIVFFGPIRLFSKRFQIWVYCFDSELFEDENEKMLIVENLSFSDLKKLGFDPLLARVNSLQSIAAFTKKLRKFHHTQSILIFPLWLFP